MFQGFLYPWTLFSTIIFFCNTPISTLFLQKKEKDASFWKSRVFQILWFEKLSPQESSPLEVFYNLNLWNESSTRDDLFMFYFYLKKPEKVATAEILSWNLNYACDDLHRQAPSISFTSLWWGVLSTKKFQPSASTRTAQLSVAATTVRLTDLLNCNAKTELILIRRD